MWPKTCAREGCSKYVSLHLLSLAVLPHVWGLLSAGRTLMSFRSGGCAPKRLAGFACLKQENEPTARPLALPRSCRCPWPRSPKEMPARSLRRRCGGQPEHRPNLHSTTVIRNFVSRIACGDQISDQRLCIRRRGSTVKDDKGHHIGEIENALELLSHPAPLGFHPETDWRGPASRLEY